VMHCNAGIVHITLPPHMPDGHSQTAAEENVAALPNNMLYQQGAECMTT
jgi:hypothetical protein